MRARSDGRGDRHRHGHITHSVVLAALILAFAGPATACPVTTLPDIEDEVMCPICGTPLATAGGPQSENQRDFIRERVERCDTKAQIKSALVAEYGPRVLAMPSHRGFESIAYIAPISGGAIGLLAVALGAIRWRRARFDEDDVATEKVPKLEDSRTKRLNEDIKRYDL